jgi:DNA-binding LytR/AlgR family response regulator
MNPVTAILAEDEPLLRAEIREALATVWPELQIVAEVGDGAAALVAMQRFNPGVLFLDIQMPGLTGLEVAQQASGRAHIVFITAYNQYATAAFEQGALDYLVKPISMARLATTVARLKERARSTPADIGMLSQLLKSIAANEERPFLNWLTVPQGKELRLVTTDEICYLRADNKYTSLFTADVEYLLTHTLRAVREKLDPRVFWQIHRSYVVNVAAIRTIHRSFRGSLEVQLKRRPELLPVSAAYTHLFKHL